MSSITSNLQDRFAEEIATKYPIYKCFMFFVVFLGLFIDKSFDKVFSIWAILGKMKLQDTFNFNNGMYSQMSIQDVLFSYLLVSAICFLYERYSFVFFKFGQSSLSDNYLKDLHTKAKANISDDTDTNMSFAITVKEELNTTKKYLQQRSFLNQVLISVLVAIGYNHRFLDGWQEYIGFALLALFVGYNIRLVIKHYVVSFIPLHVQLAVLHGNKISFPDVNEVANPNASL